MSDIETTAPPAIPAEASGQPAADAHQVDGEHKEGETPEPKAEKHPLEKELAKERRRISNLTRVRREQELELQDLRQRAASLTPKPIESTNGASGTDSEHLTLTRAEVNKLIESRAREIAPTISKQLTEREQISRAAIAVKTELGEERFTELTDDLAGIFDARKQLAVLRTEKPAAVIEYLADPDNATEADSIAQMDDFDAGRALAKLEAKLAAKSAKPEPSKAPAPIEPVRGTGTVKRALTDLSDAEFDKRRREQIKSRR